MFAEYWNYVTENNSLFDKQMNPLGFLTAYLYCLISLTLPVDLCLYMGFLIAWRIVYSRALHGES